MEESSKDRTSPSTSMNSLCWNKLKVQSCYHLICLFESNHLSTRHQNPQWVSQCKRRRVSIWPEDHLCGDINLQWLPARCSETVHRRILCTNTFFDSTHLHWFLSELWLQAPKDECWNGQRIENLVHELCSSWIDLDWRMSRTDRCWRKSRFPFAHGFPKSSKTPWDASEMNSAGLPFLMQSADFKSWVRPGTLGAIHIMSKGDTNIGFR